MTCQAILVLHETVGWRDCSEHLIWQMTLRQAVRMQIDAITALVESRRQGRDGSAREIRLEAGKSMSEVAALVGVSESAISRWENGQRQPRGRAAEKWAALLREWATA